MIPIARSTRQLIVGNFFNAYEIIEFNRVLDGSGSEAICLNMEAKRLERR